MAARRSARISAATQKAATKTTEQTSEVKNIVSKRAQKSRVDKPAAKKTSIQSSSSAGKRAAKGTTSRGPQSAAPGPSAPRKRKREASHDGERPAAPSTPPPFIPTLRPKPASSAHPDLNRPVDPHRTTATLVTPHGTHLTAYPRTIEEASPSKTGIPRPTATTGNILEQGLAHLLKSRPEIALASGIIGQQVSGAAAKSIKKKFVALFHKGLAVAGTTGALADATEVKSENAKQANDYDYGTNTEKSINENDCKNEDGAVRFPTPEEVMKCDLATLRTAGLSQRKAEYIQGLAEKFVNGELSARMLLTASDEDVLEKLIAVRGLGKWSVEMFSVFGLKRMDVFSTGDLGVQRGMAAFVGRDIAKLKAKGGGKFKYMAEKEMLEIAAPFAPYRSLFMWYMWRWENVDLAVMQN
ncbi:DNA-3-methyladenine glycosylase [Coccidioides immitis RMSCC 3703]|uniref:DNA-3-methyladenine glycosylase n=1 Tax=Coccidioides immitis RMSCC 3703 TaxID=454286 RepID=A0A0J8QMC6_COCIT|nr:DNA-3-methyladenine glycosylase [Coccidioides immitis RMSCC 3703]